MPKFVLGDQFGAKTAPETLRSSPALILPGSLVWSGSCDLFRSESGGRGWVGHLCDTSEFGDAGHGMVGVGGLKPDSTERWFLNLCTGTGARKEPEQVLVAVRAILKHVNIWSVGLPMSQSLQGSPLEFPLGNGSTRVP